MAERSWEVEVGEEKWKEERKRGMEERPAAFPYKSFTKI